MPARQGVIQQCSIFNVTTTANNFAANETFSSSSVGGFVPGSVAGVTRFVTNPTGNALRLTSNWTTRPLASRAVAVAANTNYTLNLDLLGFSVVSGYFHTVRVNIIIPGGTTIGIDYTTTGSKSINFSSINAGNVFIQISSIIVGSGPYSPNPFVDIDNFSVTNIATTTTVTNVCDVFGGGYKYSYNGQEKTDEISGAGNHTTAEYWECDTRTGRRWNLDPVPQIAISDYAVNRDNPIYYNDPKGDCANCFTSAIGAGIGALIGGGVEIGMYLYIKGSINNWSAVGCSALQGGITGGAAGFTLGASLLVTAGVAGGANAVGGAINNKIQGKPVTVLSVATDATIGAVFGAGGKLIGNGIRSLSTSASKQATSKLAQAAAEALEVLGDGSGAAYGTKADSAFAKAVNGMKIGDNVIKTEVSYLNGQVVKYGTKGSARIDARLYNKKGELVQVFDLKTGGAKLTSLQVKHIQIQTG